jgi:ComF family protein
VRERIHQLKFGAQLHWIPPLVDLLAMVYQDESLLPVDLILPVPLHIRRLRERGFNQAAFLAKELGKKIGLPVHFSLLERRVWTEPQTRLKRQERLKNVKDAFSVAKPSEAEGRSVLLIDDVFTTGTTINECARALKSAGVANVHALTVARVLPDWRPGDAALF